METAGAGDDAAGDDRAGGPKSDDRHVTYDGSIHCASADRNESGTFDGRAARHLARCIRRLDE